MVQTKEELKELAKQIFVPHENKQELQIVCPPQYQKDSKIVDLQLDESGKFEIEFSGSITKLFVQSKLTGKISPENIPTNFNQFKKQPFLCQVYIPFNNENLDIKIIIIDEIDKQIFKQEPLFMKYDLRFILHLSSIKNNNTGTFSSKFQITLKDFQSFENLNLEQFVRYLPHCGFNIFFLIKYTSDKPVNIQHLILELPKHLKDYHNNYELFLWENNNTHIKINLQNLILTDIQNIFPHSNSYIENTLLNAILPIPGITEKESFINHVQVKFDKRQLDKLLENKTKLDIAQYHNAYEELIKSPYHAHQRDEIHQYVAYFKAKLGKWPRKIIFWLTRDYFSILRPGLLSIGLALALLIMTGLGGTKNTIMFYDIIRIGKYGEQISALWKSNLGWGYVCIAVRNLLRWIFEISLSYCILATGFAIKKRWGMGNPKDFS